MTKQKKSFFLSYGVPCLALITIAIHLFFVNTKSLSKWKGGGYGMYTGIHYGYNQIYIPGMSIDSLVKDNEDLKTAFGNLLLMPNNDNLRKAAIGVLKTTDKDSLRIQVWAPTVNSKNGNYTRTLVNELNFNNSDL